MVIDLDIIYDDHWPSYVAANNLYLQNKTLYQSGLCKTPFVSNTYASCIAHPPQLIEVCVCE